MMVEAVLQNFAFYASYSLVVALVPILVVLVRCLYLVKRQGEYGPSRSKPCLTLVVLGSGGHTSEMMGIIGGLNLKRYTPRIYVSAEGDKMSQEKVERFEKANKTLGTPAVILKTIPRARKVLQSYFTSIFTTLVAIFNSCSLVMSFRPDFVLCNGPGTCIPICFWAHVLKFFGLKATKIVYVESLCRVQRLSLSGIILYYLYIADCIFVQWPRLKELYPRTKFIGRVL
jgi:beta-1,4-N-acetylglucosaminyltransferase